MGKEINTETMKQEMEQEKSIKTEIDDSCDNTYQKGSQHRRRIGQF